MVGFRTENLFWNTRLSANWMWKIMSRKIQGMYILHFLSSQHTLNWVGVKGGSIFGISLHFYVGISKFFPISDPNSHAHLPIYRMDSSNAYFDYLYFGSLFLSKKSIPDLEKQNELCFAIVLYVILNTSPFLQSRHF